MKVNTINTNYVQEPSSKQFFSISFDDAYVTIVINDINIEFFNTSPLLSALEQVLKDLEFPPTALDLANVDSVDSSGIGLFITVFKLLKNAGSKFAIFNTGPRITRILELTKMTAFLKIFKTKEELKKYFES